MFMKRNFNGRSIPNWFSKYILKYTSAQPTHYRARNILQTTHISKVSSTLPGWDATGLQPQRGMQAEDTRATPQNSPPHVLTSVKNSETTTLDLF